MQSVALADTWSKDGLDGGSRALAQLGHPADGLALAVDGARQADQLVRQPALVVAAAPLPRLATASAAVERLPVALVRDRQESLVGLHDARQFRILQRIAYRVQHLVPPHEGRRVRDAATLRRLVQRQALRHAPQELLPHRRALVRAAEYRVLPDGERLAAVLADELLAAVGTPAVALHMDTSAYRAYPTVSETLLRQHRLQILFAVLGFSEHLQEFGPLSFRQLPEQFHHALRRVSLLFHNSTTK